VNATKQFRELVEFSEKGFHIYPDLTITINRLLKNCKNNGSFRPKIIKRKSAVDNENNVIVVLGYFTFIMLSLVARWIVSGVNVLSACMTLFIFFCSHWVSINNIFNVTPDEIV
jgi:hypothetical protein